MSLSNENADVPYVMNSNRKFDVSLDGPLSFNSCCMNLSGQTAEREKISTSGCHF